MTVAHTSHIAQGNGNKRAEDGTMKCRDDALNAYAMTKNSWSSVRGCRKDRRAARDNRSGTGERGHDERKRAGPGERGRGEERDQEGAPNRELAVTEKCIGCWSVQPSSLHTVATDS